MGLIMQLYDLLIYFFVFFIGTCIGSFLTMASYRIPKKEDLIFKRSFCPKCNNKLGFLSLIPIFSWLVQGGKCRYCGEKISFRYPLIELISGIFFLLIYKIFENNIILIIYFLSLFSVIFLISIIDFETYEIPYSLQVILFILSLMFAYLSKIPLKFMIFSAFVYLAVFYCCAWMVSRYRKRDALGGGDIGLIISIGMFITLKYISIFLFLSGIFGVVCGVIYKKISSNDEFPFAPSLLFAMLIVLLINNNYFL